MLLMIGLVPSFMKNPSLASVLCFFQCGVSNALRRMSQLVEFLRFVNKPSSDRAVPLKSCCDKVMVCCGKVGNSDFGTARSLTPNKHVQRGLPLRVSTASAKPHPLENNCVASVKHCSILASNVLCFPLFGGTLRTRIARKGAEESDVCHG